MTPVLLHLWLPAGSAPSPLWPCSSRSVIPAGSVQSAMTLFFYICVTCRICSSPLWPCSSRYVLPCRICSSPIWSCSSRSVVTCRICSSPLKPCSSRSVLPAGTAQVHYDPVLLDLCFLQDLIKSTMTLFFLDLLPAGSAQVLLWPCSSRSALPAGSAQVHYDPVLLDLCYLQDLLRSTMILFF